MTIPEFDRKDFITSFGQVWKKVITDPRGFFSAMPLTGGIENPLGFALTCLLIAGLGELLTGRGFGLTLFLIIGGVLRLFIEAGLLLLISRHVFEGTGNYEATFRAVAYATAPVVFQWVPLVGFLAMLYGIYLLFCGLQRAQELSSGKALLTILLAALAGLFLSFLFGGPQRVWAFF
jgi:hypothetical protein